MKHPYQSPGVAAAFAAIPEPARTTMTDLRTVIFDIAADLPIDGLNESLKWGQPSFLGKRPNSGTPIRLGLTKSGDLAILAHCQSTVISDFRALAPQGLRFDGNRALLLRPDQRPEPAILAPLIRAALTYRL